MEPVSNNDFAVKVGIAGPLVIQALAMVALTIIIALHDGISTTEVVQALLVLCGVNGLGSATVAGLHTYVSRPGASAASAPATMPNTSGN